MSKIEHHVPDKEITEGFIAWGEDRGYNKHDLTGGDFERYLTEKYPGFIGYAISSKAMINPYCTITCELPQSEKG